MSQKDRSIMRRLFTKKPNTKSVLFELTLISMLFLVFEACVTSSKYAILPEDLPSTQAKVSRSIEDQSADLSGLLSVNSRDEELLADVKFMIQAMASEARGQNMEALKSWREATKVAKGPFGEKAFQGWLKSYAKTFDKKVDRMTFAKAILSESAGGSSIPWMVETDLLSESKLAEYAANLVPDAIESAAVEPDALLLPPNRPGIPAGDPLLTSLAKEACRYKSKFADGWDQWRQTLAKDVGLYFDALVLQCSGQATKASEQFVAVGARLGAHDATAHLGLESYTRAIKIRRDAGERDTVAPLFLPLMRLWNNPVLTESSFALSRQAFELRRIDDALAAARHLALINDVDKAKEFSNEAIERAMAAQSESWALSRDMKIVLASDIAEAYHFQAYRLAVEAKEWQRASALTKTALQLENLNSEWLLRLQWSQGLYEYLAGNFQEARIFWEKMLSDKSDEAYRPMLLFWISRCHLKLGNFSEAEFYRKTLVQDHPLSFYSVVALRSDSLDSEKTWESAFSDISALRRKLAGWREMNVDSLRNSQLHAPLMRRAEVLVAAKVDAFSPLALAEFQRSLDLQSNREEDVRNGVYLTRLYAAAGDWLSCQSITTRLARVPQFWEIYPEQILVYFPTPWFENYTRIANQTAMTSEMLLAVTRQESGFKPDAKSPAFAYGLMQFTPATARRVAQVAGIQLGKMPESLLSPSTSIELGANYLKILEVRFEGKEGLMYGAYNAGEQAVDSWVQRRNNDDPLLFLELIPYLETKSYIKNVWRNREIYAYLKGSLPAQDLPELVTH